LLAVAAIALGWDSSVLTRLSLAGTNRLEQSLIDAIKPGGAAPGDANSMAMTNSMAGGHAMMMSGKTSGGLPIEGDMPSLSGATAWLNSPALSREELRGKVVLVDFWTYSCINCLRALPYVKTWYAKYKDHGLIVIGVHAPEFAFEKDPANVKRAVSELNVTYPVALDNNYAIWQGFNNQYWPAHYFIDAAGHRRSHHFGEGNYEESEQIIRQLLAEAGYTNLPPPLLLDEGRTVVLKNDLLGNRAQPALDRRRFLTVPISLFLEEQL
jgi:thiol-disulfide isomerase/thioredoxin